MALLFGSVISFTYICPTLKPITMTALEQSIEALEIAKIKVALITKLQTIITKKIERLFWITKEATITLEAMSLKEAIAYIKTLKLIDIGKFEGRGIKPVVKQYLKDGKLLHMATLKYAMELTTYHNSSECLELLGYIEVDKTIVEVKIPINDIKDKLSSFRRSGSTYRSKITGMNILSTPEPFNTYVDWSSIHKAIFYKSAK